MDNTIPVDITPDKSLIQKLGLVGYSQEYQTQSGITPKNKGTFH